MTTAHGENDWKIRINGGEEHPVLTYTLFSGTAPAFRLPSILLKYWLVWSGLKNE
jgi:hypothetical protein